MLSTIPTQLITIGDSLSDTGVVFRLTERIFLDPLALPVSGDLLEEGPAYDGVFSDGPPHTARLAGLGQADPIAYAAGGARLLGERRVGDQLSGGLPDGLAAALFDPAVPEAERTAILDYDLNIGAQVERLLGLLPPVPADPAPVADADGTVLVTVFAGLNDMGDFAAFAADNPFAALVQAPGFLRDMLDAAEDGLRDIAGAAFVDQLAVYTLPQISFFPLPEGVSASDVAPLNRLVEEYNDGLVSRATDIAEEAGKELAIVRLDAFAAEIDANPETYGFLDKGPYYQGGGTSPDFPDDFDPATGLAELVLSLPRNPSLDPALAPARLQFFDELHFTGALHARVASFAEAVLTAESRLLGGDDDLSLDLGAARLVLGGAGDDRLFTGGQDDIVLAGTGADLVWAGLGNDVVSGGAGDDDLRGSFGRDLLAGGPGDDALRGGAGNDVLIGGPGDDTAFGGTGQDAFIWVAPSISGQPAGTTAYEGGAGFDLLWLVVDGSLETAVLDDVAGRTPADEADGRYDLPSIGLVATGVEEFVIHNAADLPPDAFQTELDLDLVSAAQDWGFLTLA